PSRRHREAESRALARPVASVRADPFAVTPAARIATVDCCSPGDSRFDQQFDARHAAGKLRTYRRNGPAGLTRLLIDGLAAGGVDGYTVLDIGGGVGAVHHELLRSGAAAAVDVDASRA